MRRGATILLVLCGAVTAFRGDGAVRTMDNAAPVASAMVLHVDPATGRYTETPQTSRELEELAAALGPAASTSGEGLVVEKSPVPGGGVMINLQGRFQNSAIAVVDAHGRLEATCAPGSEPKPSTGSGGSQ